MTLPFLHFILEVESDETLRKFGFASNRNYLYRPRITNHIYIGKNMSRVMKNKRKSEYKKLQKMVSEQETLIDMLGNYVKRTEEITREVQEEMFPKMTPESCDCCGEPVYPIIKFLHDYEFISENFESLEIEDINLGLVPVTTEESEQSVGLLN